MTWVSLPGYFKTHGYTTLGGGKTYHGGLPPFSDGDLSWSDDRPYFESSDKRQCTSNYLKPSGQHGAVCPDNSTNLTEFTDYSNMQSMISNLEYASQVQKETGKPFFLSYGIHRPHLPFHFPAEWPGPDGNTINIWEAYGPDDAIDLPLHQQAPVGMPGIAFTYEMDGDKGVAVNGTTYPIPGPNGNGTNKCPFCGPAFPDNVTRVMRKGYYSAVSWVDYCAGRVIARLHELGHAEDTVIAIVGDHGWQLGEHNIWGKHTNFELGARVPLIIRAANQTANLKSDALAESVDIYPTLAALAGLPPPDDVDGIDLSSLWTDPSPATPLKTVAYSEYPRCAPPDAAWTPEPGYTNPNSCVTTARQNFTIMGTSMRTDAWRCTFWMWWDGLKLAPDFTKPPAATELYAHTNDTESNFDTFENVNVAPNYPAVVAEMMAMARKQWEKV